MLAQRLLTALQSVANPGRAEHNKKYLQCFDGGYGKTDEFIGVQVPEIRKVCKANVFASLTEIEDALHSPYHEIRMASLIIMVEQYQRAVEAKKQREIVDLYLANVEHFINNWDLVDISAYKIIGHYYYTNDMDLSTLALDKHFWRRRIGIVSHMFWNKAGKPECIYPIADELISKDKEYQQYLKEENDLNDKQAKNWNSLIHKATGWMLRESGKKDPEALWEYVQQNYRIMPSIMRSYAIEKLSADQKSLLKKDAKEYKITKN